MRRDGAALVDIANAASDLKVEVASVTREGFKQQRAKQLVA